MIRLRSLRAFSLIELMIIIVIIGVLAAAAIPSYNAYMIRSRMSEGLGLLTSVKSKVIEYYTLNNLFPPNTSSIPTDPLGLLAVNSNFVKTVLITAGGGSTQDVSLTATLDPVKLGLGATSTATMQIILDIIAPGASSTIDSTVTNTTTSFKTVCYANCTPANQQYYPSSCLLVPSPPAS